MPPEIRPELRRLIGNHRPIDAASLEKLRAALTEIGSKEEIPPAQPQADDRTPELTSA